MKQLLFILLFLVSAVGSGGENAQSETTVQLKGRALYSFTPDYLVLQGADYIFKIREAGLSDELKLRFEKAAAQNQNLSLTVPRENVEFLWPNRPYKAQEDSARHFKKTASLLRSSAKRGKGQVVLSGVAAYSFTEGYFLVQSGDTVYQVKKSALDATQSKSMSDAGSGGRIEVTIPKGSVARAWTFASAKDRIPASTTEADQVHFSDDTASITGTVLYSFDEPLVLVESQGSIYQIRRNSLSTEKPLALDNPGSRVQLSVPLQSIVFVWTSGPETPKFSRLPAGALK